MRVITKCTFDNFSLISYTHFFKIKIRDTDVTTHLVKVLLVTYMEQQEIPDNKS